MLLKNVKCVSLENVTVNGYSDPVILSVNPGEVIQDSIYELPVRHVADCGLDVFYLENWKEVQKDLGPEYRQYC